MFCLVIQFQSAINNSGPLRTLTISMAICTMSRSCLQHLGRTSSSPSTARVFLHLASPRSLHATPPVLDFLLPTIPSRSLHNARLRHNIISRSQQLKRSFASSVQRQTTVLVHPRQDEDGQDMTVEITPRASNVCSPSNIHFEF